MSSSARKTVGFDVDHTLIRYTRKLQELIFSALATFFVEKCGYPECIASTPFDHDFCVKSIAVDLENGDFLKLSSTGWVVHALHGTKPLPPEERTRRYPGPWEHFEALRRHEKSSKFFYFVTYFDVPAAWLLALLIDHEDEAVAARGDGSKPDYHKFAPDLIDAFNFNFDPAALAEKRGWYFPRLESNIAEYVYPRKDMRSKLESMRAAGTLLFVVTNAHFDSADLLMRFAFGDDWRDLFCSVVAFAMKPAFFESSAPFREFDTTAMKETGHATPRPVIRSCSTSTESTPVYVGGNAAALQDALGVSKILYVGDHLVGDVRAAKMFGWDTVAVVEEAVEVSFHAMAVRALQTLPEDMLDSLGPRSPRARGSAAEAADGQPVAQTTARALSRVWGSFYGHSPTAKGAGEKETEEEEEEAVAATLGAVLSLQHSDSVVSDVTELEAEDS